MVGKALKDERVMETKEINKHIYKLNISDNVVLTGFVEDRELVAIYNLAKVTVLPSHYEGFGLPVLESMACGTSVVCSNVASLSEIGKNAAIFCDPTNPNDISNKILLAISQNKKNEKNLIQHAGKFTWHKVAKENIVYNLKYSPTRFYFP